MDLEKKAMNRLALTLLLALPMAVTHAAEPREDLQPSARFSVYGKGAAATPPMGWNPWNAFRTEVDQAKILAVADTIKRTGLQAAGYRYINIDDGWWLKRRADGGIEIRTSMFPIAKREGAKPSFRPWTDRLHAMGFKAGLYTDVGRNACSQAWDPKSPNLPVGTVSEREVGLDGFEYQDLKTVFQDWGFDYLKVDACGLADFDSKSEAMSAGRFRAMNALIVRGEPKQSDLAGVETLYARVGRLLAEVNPDNDYVFSICPWGEAGVRDWGNLHGNLWRTSADIEPTWKSMLHNFDSASRRELYAGPGRWNDPDMLAIGLGEFDEKHLVEARSHFSLWSVLAAPLLLGFDLNHASPALIELLSNPEVIAVNQDPAGNQANLVSDDDRVQVLVKPLSGRGERAVVLLNRGENAVSAQVDARQMKLNPDASLRARDLWRHQDLPLSSDVLRFELEPHGSVMLKVSGTPLLEGAKSLGEISGRIHVAVDGVAEPSGNVVEASGTPRVDFTPYGQGLRIAGKRYEYGIGAHANSRLEVLANREFKRFSASVGVDDSSTAKQDQSVVFAIYGDGKPLYRSAPRRRGDSPIKIDVAVAQVQVLELVAIAADTQRGHATPLVAWAGAGLQ